MKCQYCGSEIKAGQKFCNTCGKMASSSQGVPPTGNMGMKKCPRCGKQLNANVKHCSGCGLNLGQGTGDQPPKKSHALAIVLGILGGVAVLTILAVVGGYFYLKNKAEDIIGSTTPSTQAATTTQQNTYVEEDQDDDGDVIGDQDNDDTGYTEDTMTMEYVDNTYCNPDANLSKDAFERVVSEDGTFYFSYPKYVFNNFEYKGDNDYYFSYEENGNAVCYMHVYKASCSGDPIQNGINNMSMLKNQYSDVFYYFPEDIREHGVGDDKIMQVVVCGRNYSDTSEYNVFGNDGSDNYCLTFGYPDPDHKNEVENWDYIINCVYRMSSFGGSKHQPYENYEEFYEEQKEE